MAIKGKKKSQKRGSQARRRPAAPPRPAVSPRRKTAWYRNPTIVAILGTLAIIAIAVIVWAVQSSREDAEALERKQNQLTNYTDRVRTVLQTMRTPVSAMAGAPATIEDEAQAEKLAKDADTWARELEEAQGTFAGIAPSAAVQSIHGLYTNALEMYVLAARTYDLAATTSDAKTQTEALNLATTQRTQADAIWTEATALLDRQRDAAEMDPSGLTAPGGAAPGATPGLDPGQLPTELPTDIPTEELPQDGGGGGNQGGGDQGGQQGGGGGNDQGAGSNGP